MSQALVPRPQRPLWRPLQAVVAGLLWLAADAVSAQTLPQPALAAKPATLAAAEWPSLQRAIADAVNADGKLLNPAPQSAGDGAPGDEFGFAVALDGDTALVGVHFDDLGASGDAGGAYVFVRQGGVWSRQAKLVANGGGGGDQFGRSVALHGNTAVVGAHGHDIGDGPDFDQGAAWVFVRSGTTWTQQAMLSAADGEDQDRLGWSVAVHGDVAMVGVYLDDIAGIENQGSVRVFTRSAGAWTEQATLSPPGAQTMDHIGYSVALDADTLLIGAPDDDVGANSAQGSVHVYVGGGASWSWQAQLVATGGMQGDELGRALALSGDTALAGAAGDDDGPSLDQGAAYVFVRTGTTWSEQAQLLAAGGAAADNFGLGVALDGEVAMVGAPGANFAGDVDRGAAYVFQRTGTSWSTAVTLSVADGASDDRFGHALALSGGNALIAARGDDVMDNLDQGSVRVFSGSGTSFLSVTQLDAGAGAAGANFGYAVAVSDDTLLVGSRRQRVGENAEQGVVYVYTNSGSGWSLSQTLAAADGAAGDGFGASVALLGDRALIGAPGADVLAAVDQGAAYTFERSGGLFVADEKIALGDAGDALGSAVALLPDHGLLGAPGRDHGAALDQGAVEAISFAGGGWTAEATLVAAAGVAGDRFGHAVAAHLATVVAGAPDATIDGELARGAAWVFVHSGGTWSEQARLVQLFGDVGGACGSAVTVWENTAAIGCPGYDDSFVDEGTAVLFDRTGTSWMQGGHMISFHANHGIRAGAAVALRGDRLVIATVGATATVTGQGGVYVFRRDDSNVLNFGWVFETSRVLAPDPGENDHFGAALALSDTRLAIGAPDDDGLPPFGNIDEGSVYLYRVSTPTTTTLASNLDPAFANQAVTLTASVTGRTPGGTVTFRIADVALANCTALPLTGTGDTRTSTCTQSALAVGDHQFSARYNGDERNTESLSDDLIQDILAPVLTVAPATLPGATFGASYNATFTASGTGGVAPFAFTLASGSLPAGLALASNGTLSGTPGAAGSAMFTVRATDASTAAVGGPFSGTRPYTLVVAPAMTSVTLDGGATQSDRGAGFARSASIAVVAPGAGTPQGTLTITAINGATSRQCTATVSSAGSVGCTLAFAFADPVGNYGVTASFAPGDGNFTASTSGSATHTLFRGVDVSVSKDDARSTYDAGERLDYIIDVANTGPDQAIGIRLLDTPPAALLSVGWSCAAAGGATCPTPSGAGAVDQTVDLPVGGSVTYTLGGTVTTPAPDSIVNQASAQPLPGSYTRERAGADNVATDTDRLRAIFADGFETP